MKITIDNPERNIHEEYECEAYVIAMVRPRREDQSEEMVNLTAMFEGELAAGKHILLGEKAIEAGKRLVADASASIIGRIADGGINAFIEDLFSASGRKDKKE